MRQHKDEGIAVVIDISLAGDFFADGVTARQPHDLLQVRVIRGIRILAKSRPRHQQQG
jgi:hypothetical protein